MTNTQKNTVYTENVLHARAQFHKEYAGEIKIWDFNTTYCNPHRDNPFTYAELKNRKNASHMDVQK